MKTALHLFFGLIALLVFTVPIAIAQDERNTFTVDLVDLDGRKVRNALVHLTTNGVTTTKRTGEDGRVIFHPAADGPYVVSAERSGFSFADNTGTFSTSATVEMVGAAAALTVTGTVHNDQNEALPSASLTLNGQSVTIQENGSFSVEMYPGEEYTLAITHEDYYFVHESRTFTAHGNRSEIFIGSLN